MFWGLIMEPKRQYSQVVQRPFHISMAAIDISTPGDDYSQVMCRNEGKNYLLCTLKKGEIVQCPLDLMFEAGNKITFATNGSCNVHLTGYLLEEDQLDLSNDEEEEEEVEEETVRGAVKRSKGSKDTPRKKSKTCLLLNDTLEEESDDSDVNLSDLMEESEDEGQEEEEDDGSDDDDVEEEEDLSSLSEEESPKSKQNGIALKKDQKQKKKVPEAQREKQTTKEDQKKKNVNKKEIIQNESPAKGSPQKKTVEGGVIIEDIKLGNGPFAKTGSFVTVYYEGRLKNNNKMFDSSTKGPGFKFRLGKKEVIKGWDVGLVGMKVGGKRRITCPPHMAYGPKGSPPIVPPNSTLIFEVELKHTQ